MKDATLIDVDNEPWNQGERVKPRGDVVPILSVYERVCRGIGIFSAPGKRAEYVYDVVSGASNIERTCEDCAIDARVYVWIEYQWSQQEDRYLVRRDLDLCDACGESLRGMQIGARWKRSRSKQRVLCQCIKMLDRVGHREAADLLRALEQ